ncbi:MAG TPA: hypothetical protein VG474_07755, partial [Solirubrobacteraceae bacterium]|nr:hypothetical protein [Solirubrobacteraceae bacterium]
MTPHSRDIAAELKNIIRVAGRDPERLEGALPALSRLHRVASAGVPDEPARVHFILHRLIPEYLARLPGGRDCRAIRELLRWEDEHGELQSLTTRYHKAAAHLVYAASDFGRRQEPRLLLECARRFIALDHEDRLAVDAAFPAQYPPVSTAPEEAAVRRLADAVADVGDPHGGIVRVHRNLDYHLLVECMGDAAEIFLLNTWIPGLDILADTLADALARGASVSVLMLHPDSRVAQLRSRALQGAAHERFRQDRVRPGVRHCLDVLASIARTVEDDSRRNLHVRLYDSLPSLSVYRVDERAFVSFLLHGQLAVKSLQIEVLGVQSVLGRV